MRFILCHELECEIVIFIIHHGDHGASVRIVARLLTQLIVCNKANRQEVVILVWLDSDVLLTAHLILGERTRVSSVHFDRLWIQIVSVWVVLNMINGPRVAIGSLSSDIVEL